MTPWLVILFNGLFMGSATAICVQQGLALRRSLRRLAASIGGRVVRDHWLGAERIEADIDGVPCRLLYVPWQHRCLRVSFAWNSKGRLSVSPKGWGDRFEEVFTGVQIPLGDRAFERRFRVQGAPTEWVQAALDEPTRVAITALADLCRFPLNAESLRFESGPTGVSVICTRLAVLPPAALARFFELAVRILRGLRPVDPEVIGVLTAEEVAKQGVCPVCGYALGGRMMRCTKCNTLHHEDCWKYFGGCAIFGCDAGRGDLVGKKGMPGIPPVEKTLPGSDGGGPPGP